MKTILVAAFGSCLLPLMPTSVQAGVKIDIRLGSSGCLPCQPLVTSPIYCAPLCVAYPPPCAQPYVVLPPPCAQPCVVPPPPFAPCYRSVYRPPCYEFVEHYSYIGPEQVVVVRQSPSIVSTSASAQSVSPDPTFYRLGRDWAKDLRNDVVTWDQLVNYLKEHVVKASNQDYDEFRRGFLSAYEINGVEAFNKAFQQARGD